MLSPSPDETNESTENRIVTLLQSLGPPGTLPKEDELSNVKEQVRSHLQRLGIDWDQFTSRVSNSIESYFLCESEQQLSELREHYETGLMKAVLESIFSLLAGEQMHIGQLLWTTGEYQNSQQQFSALMSKSFSRQLPEFPNLEVNLVYAVELCAISACVMKCCVIIFF